MKKQLIINSLVSGGVGLVLGIFDLFVFQNITSGYYCSVVFFWVVYSAQSLVLFQKKIKPASFIMLYNLTTVIKMVFSGIFIVVYFIVLNTQVTYSFLAFFLFLYFSYLIINTRIFFNVKNGKAH